MWSALVVVNHPFPQDDRDGFIQDDPPIQALATGCADQPFAERIRLRHRTGVFNRQPHRPNRVVDRGCINGVAVVDQKSWG